MPAPGRTRLHLFDVVSEWRAWTGRPAVLAVWAARRAALEQTEMAEVVADFQASKQYGLAHIPEIAANAAATLGLPQAHLESYLLDNIDYSLDEENRAGLNLFFEKAAAAGIVPLNQPLHYAGKPDAARVAARGSIGVAGG